MLSAEREVKMTKWKIYKSEICGDKDRLGLMRKSFFR